ncbi:MAG: hypothetical protein CMP47_09860 [Rickettsiales bacterium]|nr:hypothetical protein [Rickettsiales bacterium]
MKHLSRWGPCSHHLDHLNALRPAHPLLSPNQSPSTLCSPTPMAHHHPRQQPAPQCPSWAPSSSTEATRIPLPSNPRSSRWPPNLASLRFSCPNASANTFVIYTIRPIIHEPSFLSRLHSPKDLSVEEKILVLSLCATTVLHAAPQSDLQLDKKLSLGRHFVELCLHLRQVADWAENTTLLSIQASYHIAVALFELKRPRAHAFYLREAVGMALDQGLHLESTYHTMDDVRAICSRRTVALLFITERGLAILRNKPTQMTRLPRLSTEYFDETDGIVLAGFSALATLFSILDEKFVRLWSGDPNGEPVDNIASLQHALNEMSFDTPHGNFAMTDVQRADVLITHQWLRLIFWQASMRQGLISYSANNPIFSALYPITIAKDLCDCVGLDDASSYDAILVHGMGIFEKIFEVAYTLMDALTIANQNWSESWELRCLFNVLSASPNSQSTYVKMLRTKLESERSPPQSPPLNS